MNTLNPFTQGAYPNPMMWPLMGPMGPAISQTPITNLGTLVPPNLQQAYTSQVNSQLINLLANLMRAQASGQGLQGLNNNLGGSQSNAGGASANAGNTSASTGPNGASAKAGPNGSGADFSNPPGTKKGTYTSKGTGYYPANNAMEGGFKDMKGNKLYTLQDYLAGKAPYVSVAMDKAAGLPYGTKLRIAELEKKYGRPIQFRVVDTGGAFKGKGTGRIDICTANNAASQDPTINGKLTLQVV